MTERKLYQGDYKRLDTQEDTPDTQDAEGNDTVSTDPTLTPEEETYKKRYGDLRSHQEKQNQRIKELESQLRASQRQEVRIPSSPDELEDFSRRYPDLYRHIRSVAMTELLDQKEDIKRETDELRGKLEATERELGLKLILKAHPDFEAVNASEEFQAWARIQPDQIRDWLFESSDPVLCIKGLDLFKAEHNHKQKTRKREPGADSQIKTRTVPEPSNGEKPTWKESDIRKLKPKEFEKLEAEIEAARREGRIEYGV